MSLESATHKDKDTWLPVDKIIEIAKKEGINLGKGNPYNRLRYYTRMGWIPHMRRIGKTLKGHYPKQVIDTLKQIQKLKEAKVPNKEISKILNTQTSEGLFRIDLQGISYKIKRSNIKILAKLILLGGVLAYLNQIRLIKLYESKQEIQDEISSITARKTQ